MKNTRHAWLVRPYPCGERRIYEFRNKNIVAIGWYGIGSLFSKSREELKKVLSGEPYSLSGLALGNAYATVDIFVNQMDVGDLVLVPDGDDIYFAEIVSDYYFDATVDNESDGYPHQRRVKWLSDTSRKELTMALRSSLKVHRTAANLSHHAEEIDALANGVEFVPKNKSGDEVQVTYPLRPEFSVSFSVPRDMTQDEAQRLSTYLASLYFVK